ncbi:hypothetical protein B0J13DRAFT_322452 [Dactylonectria estremocensis]|uniref:Peptidase S8/S53 domain-containing protein n=1 Tax=Dactylonectria estremocensis TaxID=1079267 RepID=A0A9P9J3B0_9HYPO|nr:hypothetical protein B0J13DRAFT_322452 [Dactylonectria estremocensis]
MIMDDVKWDADIISMSFGYPNNQIYGGAELEKAIEHADLNNVLLFAAASNSGANLHRAHPAREPAVLDVHATDSRGSRSKFSPTALANYRNIATVSEDAEPLFPIRRRDTQTKDGRVEPKSGTPFPTLILV